MLDINPFFYPKSAMDEAAKEFKKICSIKSRQNGNRILVELDVSKQFDAEEAALAFLNYALSIRKEVR